MKTISSGYASLDYEDAGEQPADVVALQLKVNSNTVDALTRIVRRNKYTTAATRFCAHNRLRTRLLPMR